MKTALLLLSLTALGVRAAPVNDAFVDRISLGSAAPAEATGSNAGATLETDENDLDSVGGASVWWSWTASASGWVTVDTAGSAIDTVLAVLSDGPTLDDTFIVGCNDESGAVNAPFGSSRVVFLASAGVEYHLAVHGFLGAQGEVRLHLETASTPPLIVETLSLAPQAVNVSSEAQGIVAEIGISSGSDLAEGIIAVHKASFSGVLEIPFGPAQRVSGTATNGVYRVSISVPRYSSPGTWLLEVGASDALEREVVFGRGVSASFEYDYVLPDGAAGLFSVSNTGPIDDLGPVLETFSRSPAAVSVVAGPANLSFAFRVTDDLSGFGSGLLTLFTPSGAALTALEVTAAQRTSGTALDGTYSLTFSLPPNMPDGTWFATLLLRDAAGNPALYDGAFNGEDFPSGAASAEIAVTGVANSYWSWLYPVLATSPGAAPMDDLDGDALSNLAEFAFGLSASRPDASLEGAMTHAVANGTLSLTFVRRRADSGSGVACGAQFSGDLSSSSGWQAGVQTLVTPLNDQFERVTFSAAAPAMRQFGRVQILLAE